MPSELLVKPWMRPAPKTYIFRNATIVDPVEGKTIPKQTVKLSNGRITSITDSNSSGTEAKTVEIDLTGRYLCPGLIDAHVHLTATPGEGNLEKLFGMDPTVSSMRQPYTCQQMLRRGFTSVRDCGGASFALKEAIADGVFPGPRLFIAGHALTQTGGHADYRGVHDHTECCGGAVKSLGRLCDGVPECIKAAREELRTGADFIKIMGGGGVSSPTDKLENLQFTAEEIQAISTVASNNGTYVTAHAYTPASIRHCVNNGAKGIEHGNLMDTETAKFMAEKGVFLTPTLITYSTMASDAFAGFLPPESKSKNEEVLQAGLNSLKIAADAGITLCYGTDLLGPLGIAQTQEFGLRAQVLGAAAVLKSATINPAKMFGQENALGQIKPGYIADMLICKSNPLEDITIFDRPAEQILAVIKEGRVEVSRWSKLPEEITVSLPVIE